MEKPDKERVQITWTSLWANDVGMGVIVQQFVEILYKVALSRENT